jgi:hypothetical protein
VLAYLVACETSNSCQTYPDTASLPFGRQGRGIKLTHVGTQRKHWQSQRPPTGNGLDGCVTAVLFSSAGTEFQVQHLREPIRGFHPNIALAGKKSRHDNLRYVGCFGDLVDRFAAIANRLPQVFAQGTGSGVVRRRCRRKLLLNLTPDRLALPVELERLSGTVVDVNGQD